MDRGRVAIATCDTTTMAGNCNEDSKIMAMSDIIENLLSSSQEKSILEREIHVYDPKEIQSGWKCTSSSVKYLVCPVSGRRRIEQTTEGCPVSIKNDSKKGKKTTTKSDFDGNNSGFKYDKFKSLGVFSYQVPSWRTIINPETWCYVHRLHPCLYFSSTDKEPGNLRALTFVDPAGVLDQHLGVFVQRQRARNAFQADFANYNYRLQNVKFSHQQLPQNDLKPLAEEKFDSQSYEIVTTAASKPHVLQPLPLTTFKDNLLTSTITIKSTTKNLPPVLLTNKHPTIETASGQIHSEVLQSQKVKLAPYIRQLCKPVKHNREPKKKLNWLPIPTMSPCLAQKSGKSVAMKPGWSKLEILSQDHPSNINIQMEQMPIKQ